MSNKITVWSDAVPCKYPLLGIPLFLFFCHKINPKFHVTSTVLVKPIPSRLINSMHSVHQSPSSPHNPRYLQSVEGGKTGLRAVVTASGQRGHPSPAARQLVARVLPPQGFHHHGHPPCRMTCRASAFAPCLPPGGLPSAPCSHLISSFSPLWVGTLLH